MNSTPPLLLRLRRALRWHRRLLAAVAAAVAVASTLVVLRPAAPPTEPVVVAAGPVEAGRALRPADLDVRHYPVGLAPHGSFTDPTDLVGRVAVASLTPGTPVGAGLLLDPTRTRAGRKLVPLRVPDPTILRLLRVGDLVTVIGSGDAGDPQVLARGVRVAALPTPERAGALPGPDEASLMIVDADERTAVKLGAWSSNPGLSVVLG